MINEIVKQAQAEGLRVYLAERGDYGFFTNGERVVSFSLNLGAPRFSGNYKTNKPKQTGTGWGIMDEMPISLSPLLERLPPRWAIGSAAYRFTTPDEYLGTYNRSSKFTEQV